MSNWTLLSNHGHVLVFLARDPEARLRDVATAVGITERAVQSIVRDLQESGMISVSKQGRRNQYRIHRKVGLRHELEADRNIGGLIDFVTGKQKPAAEGKRTVSDKPKEAAKPPQQKDATTGVAESKPAVTAEPAPTATKESEPAVKKTKATKKTKTKSEIEKQQGSLF